MSAASDLALIPELPDQIIQAGLNGNLIVFVGAGISRLLGLPSWEDMALGALKDLLKVGLINYSELEQLKELKDPKKQLSIAKILAKDKYDLDLTKNLRSKAEGESIYKILNDIGCTFVTTNYDLLLNPQFNEFKYDPTKSASVTPKECIRITDKNNLLPKFLTNPGTVIHLHGSIQDQSQMIVTTKDYLTHYDNSNVQLFLNELFGKYVILFLGYGLEEAEILEHILRRGSADKTPELKRFVLQGFFNNQSPLYNMLHQYYEESFGVSLLGFIKDHNGYDQQKDIILDWSYKLKIRKPELIEDINRIYEVLG